MSDSLLLLLGIAALWGGLVMASRRFERKRRKDGTWNEHGPVNPTWAPPSEALRGAAISIPTIPTIESPTASDVQSDDSSRPLDKGQ